MRIVLCDRHRLFAESFAHVLETLGHDVWLVASASDAVEAVASAPTDACLLELEPDDQRALAAITTLRTAHPQTRIVILYSVDDPRLLEAVLAVGVTGVMSKAQGLDNVIATLGRLMNGPLQNRGPVHLAGVARRVTRSQERSINDLTPREREALRLLALGHGTGAVALALGVSYSTARTHIQNVLAKLEVHSRLEAVAVLHQQEGVAFKHRRPEPRGAPEPSRPREGRMVL